MADSGSSQTHLTPVGCLLLTLHAALAGWLALCISPTCDEVGHLPAGLYCWEFGRFDVYRVNPPLIRALAALPVVCSQPKLNWKRYVSGARARPEWALGEDFVAANDEGDRGWLRYFVMARWACIPLSVLGGYVVWRWATELYSREAGLLALVLWCTCPNVLAWASTICPDLGATSLGLAASYLFWRWLRRPSWRRAMAAGVVLGLAELSKTTWIILYALWPLMWLTWQAGSRRDAGAAQSRRLTAAVKKAAKPLAQLAAMLALGVYVINLGYGFEGSCRRLEDYDFVSQTLTGKGIRTGNRFAGTALGKLRLPLPENYVSGIDLQKADFEAGKDSYLCGEWKHGGWWYYYLFVAILKVPLGTWALGLMALVLTWSHATRLRPRYFAGWRNELVLLLPAAAVFVLVSSQTGFSRYFRYVLPAFPYVYVWIGKVASSVPLGQRTTACAMAGAVAWTVGSSAMVYPHSMSYFNELAGGPTGGHRYVIDANVDWGQDMVYLAEWLERHPEAAPLYMAYLSFIKPRHFGIDHATPPEGPHPDVRYDPEDEALSALGPRPGWYAMSIHRTHSNRQRYLNFLDFEPVARAGYSINLYHITPEAANRERVKLGLPPLRQDDADARPPNPARRVVKRKSP
ncbi:MAG TPA: glycosyltransferase family 39 protein [Pirellulales bacterium]|nr:glycosyltransferase family 39 protein [Pirellulales bacterium]